MSCTPLLFTAMDFCFGAGMAFGISMTTRSGPVSLKALGVMAPLAAISMFNPSLPRETLTFEMCTGAEERACVAAIGVDAGVAMCAAGLSGACAAAASGAEVTAAA